MSPQIAVQVESAQLNRMFRQIAATTGKKFGSLVLQNARLIAWNLAHNTQPWPARSNDGMNLTAKKLGEAAVMRDIGQVYMTAVEMFELLRDEDEKMARAWYQSVKKGNFRLAEDILRRTKLRDRNAPIGTFEPGFHKQSRNRSGGVSRHRAALIVPDTKPLKAYIKQRQKMVGFAKAGWITAGAHLGKISRVPAWITRHVGSAPGSGINNTKRVDPHAILSNQVSYANRVCTPDAVAHALRLQREKMIAHAKNVIAGEAKKAGFRVSGDQGQPMPNAA